MQIFLSSLFRLFFCTRLSDLGALVARAGEWHSGNTWYCLLITRELFPALRGSVPEQGWRQGFAVLGVSGTKQCGASGNTRVCPSWEGTFSS